jgi:hypothetical protein
MTTFSDDALAALVAVAQAHGIRTQARRSARMLKKDSDGSASSLQGAEAEARAFFMYDDCGDHYQSDYEDARAADGVIQPIFRRAVEAEIEAERNYKRVKLRALEAYPELGTVIEKLLVAPNAPTSEIAA